MKTSAIKLIIFVFFIVGCSNDDYVLVDFYEPVYQSFEEFRANSVEITVPQSIEESGKIYVYGDYIFVNDANKGIHIIDNTNPTSPVKKSFIKINGNTDMEVKNNYLYANSYMDLVVFNLSDMNNISQIVRLNDVFQGYVGIAYNDNGIIVDYKLTQKWVKKEDNYLMYTDATSESLVGQGGSLARFKIVNNHLYTVDDTSIDVFSIANLASLEKLNRVGIGWGIETIFNKGNHLFLGSRSGMYIYNIDNPDTPIYISEIQHTTSCDPVVVDSNYAYVTLRGGNLCGTQESLLEVIDISTIEKPTLTKRYTMKNPYGLGIKDNFLFICDGDFGLKVYNKTDVENIELLQSFENIKAFDVIPTTNNLLMIGNNTIYQYKYNVDSITLISEFSLN